MENTLYQVANNLTLEIREVKYVKKTGSFYYRNEKSRDALNTNYYKSFDKKEDAVAYLRYIIERQISSTKSTLEHYQEKLDDFYLMYKNELGLNI